MPSDPQLWLSKRFLVAFVLFLCFINFQLLRNNVNITVVEMISNKSITQGNRTITLPPDFNWDSITVGLVLSILAYGGLLSFLGGFLVDWLGGSVNSSLCMFIAGIITIIHPIALYLDFRLFLACRFVTGMFESFFYVSTADIFARWFPKSERSTLISFSFNGTNVGVAIVYAVCGYLAHTWGWQMVFYVTGATSVICSIFCLIIVKNRPSQDKWISKKELKYILEETESTSMTEINHPYKSILTSGPVWSICIVMFAYMWINTVVGSCLPLYLQDITDKSIYEIGLISSIPNIVFIFSFPMAGAVMSYWSNHSRITVTRIHKIMVLFACISSTIALLLITMMPEFLVSLLSIVVIQIVTSFMALIIELVPVTLHAGSSSVIVGLLSVFLSISAIISQSVTSLIVANHAVQEWNNCFLLASSILLLSGVIFAKYGSSEPQPWFTSSTLVDNRRQSVISLHFSNDASKLPVRSVGLFVRRISINNSELQTRVRKLSLKNTEIHNRVRKLSTTSLDLRENECKPSLRLEQFSRIKYERRSSAIVLGTYSEKVRSERLDEYRQEIPQDDDEHHLSVIPTIKYPSEILKGEHPDSHTFHKSSTEPSFENLPRVMEEYTRRSSMNYSECFNDQGNRTPSIKSIQFIDDQEASSIDGNSKCLNKDRHKLSDNTLKCREDHHIRKSSIKSIQFSDDERGSTATDILPYSKDQRRSPINSLKNPKNVRRSSLKVTEYPKNERRSSLKVTEYPKSELKPSIKSVQFVHDYSLAGGDSS